VRNTGGLTPAEGGYSGETFLAETTGERTVVRIYAHRGAARGPEAVEVDAAVLRLVRGLLPVAEVLEVRRADQVARTPGLLVTSYLEGARLDLVLPAADTGLRAVIGRNLGDLLARLAMIPMLRAGVFLDGDLRIGSFPEGAGDLSGWVDAHLEATALADWSAGDQSALRELAGDAEELLDDGGRTCLVHSDFNPKNLLVDPETGEVTGLVDWEFAHAGHRFTDLGNLLRFDRDPALADVVLATYADRVPDAPADLADRARAADLYALVDLAARAGQNPVADRAHALLVEIARTGDLHAHPG